MLSTSTDEIPPDLDDEITSINSIYNEDTLSITSSPSSDLIALILTLPQTPVSLLLYFPKSYPSSPPSIERVTHVDDTLPKGFGKEILDLARQILVDLTIDSVQAGNVVIYELIEALETRLADESTTTTDEDQETASISTRISSICHTSTSATTRPIPTFIPTWILSEPSNSHKSTFLARVCAVTCPTDAHAAIQHLLATDKRTAKATHNMWAYRIRKGAPMPSDAASAAAVAQVVYADMDDDGEDGAGAKLAALLQAMGAWGVLVVVSRWYGGVKLGPERWRLIGSVGREAVVRGGDAGLWVVERT